MEIIELEILKNYGPQLGEITWHTFTGDPRVKFMSQMDFSTIDEKIQSYKLQQIKTKVKILELCSNNHFSGYNIKKKYGFDVTLFDISSNALDEGRKIARDLGISEDPNLVSGDYHSLPFADEEFDFVYMFESIHHTQTPQIVMNEVYRVLKPGGIFSLNTEPVKRELCSFSFKTNRKEELTLFEKALWDDGVLGLYSYPTAGSRPEDLFFMTENGEIDLSFYLDNQKERFDILSKNYGAQELSSFEESVVNYDGCDESFIQFTRSSLDKSLKKASAFYGNKEQLMGFTLPIIETEKNIQKLLSNRDLFKEIKNGNESIKCRLFGGTISIDYKKKNNSHVELIKTESSLPINTKNNFNIDLYSPLLPHIQSFNKIEIEKIFPSCDWETIVDAGENISILNKTSTGTINLPYKLNKISVIVGRFYGIESEQPYRVQLLSDDTEAANIIVCRNESRFFRKISKFGKQLTFSLTDMDGKNIHLPGHVRFGVLQMFSITN